MKYVLFALALMSAPAFADNGKVTCEVIEGEFPNSMLKAHEIWFESKLGEPSIADAPTLHVNVFGQAEVFVPKATSVVGGGFMDNGGTKLDYTLTGNEDVKAVVLIDRSPGSAARREKFKALVVITGVKFRANVGDAPFMSMDSLVYNLKCKL